MSARRAILLPEDTVKLTEDQLDKLKARVLAKVGKPSDMQELNLASNHGAGLPPGTLR